MVNVFFRGILKTSVESCTKYSELFLKKHFFRIVQNSCFVFVSFPAPEWIENEMATPQNKLEETNNICSI